jgi:GAF domain-containing protein/ligand-binding sensor domain-containing protein
LELSSSQGRLPALGNALIFDHYSIEDGLSQSSGKSIFQDSKGYVWIGTEDGLNRFDGYEFKVYRHDPEDPASLGNNYINAILEGPQGVLWLGTYGGGLDRFDTAKGEFSHYRHNPEDVNSLSDDQILTMIQDSEGMLWIGTRGGGLNRFDPVLGEWQRYRNHSADPSSLASNDVTALFEDGHGVIWVGTSRGLDRFDRTASSFHHFRNEPGDPASLSANVVADIAEDQAGNLWIATAGGGINEFDRESGSFVHHRNRTDDNHSLSSDLASVLLVDALGGLWAGTDLGINRFEEETGRWHRYRREMGDPQSLSDDGVTSMALDRSGGLWIGTSGGGINRYDLQRDQFALYRARTSEANSLSESSVWAMLEGQEGVLWIGTDGGGLNCYDRNLETWTQYRHDAEDPTSLSNDVVLSLFEDSSGSLWLGTWGGGLNRLDSAGNEGQPVRFTRFKFDAADPNSLSSDVVWAIHEDRQGTLWVGTALGLNALDPETEQFTRFFHDPDDPYSLSDNDVGSIHEDSRGNLWFGTHSGLSQLESRALRGDGRARFARFQHDPGNPQSLSHNIVFSIHEDQAGTLWFGTWGGGLNRFDRESGTFSHYRVKDGLPNDVIYGILEEASTQSDQVGSLWLSTNKGISRFDMATETFDNFDAGDGLQSNEFNFNSYLLSRSGEMFFGGIGGFNAFYPEAVTDNPHLPVLTLTSITQGGDIPDLNGAVDALDAVTFHWPENDFEFEFTALSYYQPAKNQYAYKLEGYDDDWNYVGVRRFGSYTNLPGGDYVLRLMGTNNDGLWSEEGVALAINIVPPFWATWWFWGFVVIALVLGSVGAYRLRVRGIEARSRELESEVASRTKELAALNSIAAVVSRSLDRDQILTDALAKTLEVTGLEAGGIYLLKSDSLQAEAVGSDDQTLRIVAHQGLGPEFVASIDNLMVGEGFSGRVVQSCDPLVVPDLADDARLTRSVVATAGFRSAAIAPLVSRAEVLGSLFVITRVPTHFSSEDVDLLTAIGGQIGVAIENARFFEGEQRRAEQFRVISEAGHHLASILDADQLMAEIVRLIQETFGYYEVGIGLIEGDELVIKTSSGIRWQDLEGPPIRLKVGGEGSMAWVADKGRPLLIPDVHGDSRYAFWPHTARTRSGLAVPLRTKAGVIGVLNVESDQVDAFDNSDVMVLQSLADQAAIAIDNARFLEAEQRRAEQFRILAEAGRRMTLTLEIHQVLQQMVRLVQQSLGYYHVAIGVIEGDEVVFRVGAGELWDDPAFDFKPSRLRVGKEGITGWVAFSGESLMVPDVEADSRYVWMRGSVTRSELAVPIVVKEQVIGVLDAQSDEHDAFDETDLSVLQSVAHQAGAAIENARLYEQAQQAAVLEERSRLARDLHDAVTQTLFSASLIAEAVPATWEMDEGEGRELLHELQRLTRGALAEMRTLLLELRPAALMETSLSDLLRQLAAAIAGRAGAPVEVTVEGECLVPPEVHVALYRIAQEALNNVVKHARASNVTVDMTCGGFDGGQRVKVQIKDDGRGFDQDAVSPDHLGLSIMRERAQAIGADLSVTSAPGSGTEVAVVWEPAPGPPKPDVQMPAKS